MNETLISCIIPVFNGERYVRGAVDSILAQTHRPLEIIVVDDGSTDGTASVIAGYGNRVCHLSQSNVGPAAARNFGLKSANGEFVAFLDQDDLCHPEKLERQMARFKARPELDICITHAQVFWIPELQREKDRIKSPRVRQPLPAYTTGALLTRRDLFDSVGFFNPDLWFGDATDWFLRAADRGAVLELLPDVLLYHRMHHSNLTRRRADASRDEFLRIVKASLDRRRLAEACFFPPHSGSKS